MMQRSTFNLKTADIRRLRRFPQMYQAIPEIAPVTHGVTPSLIKDTQIICVNLRNLRTIAFSRFIGLVVVLCSACGSAPVHYHTLVPPPVAVVAGQKALAISVLRVTVPPQVDIPQLVLRQGAGSMALVESEQWIGPLGDELRSALAAELAARLNATDMTRLRAPAALPLYRVRMDIHRFESQLGKSALVDALWTLQSPQKDAAALVCSSRVEVAADSGYSGLVRAHQQALAQIAAQIARAIGAGTKTPNACPTPISG